jgi:hypothetical protein
MEPPIAPPRIFIICFEEKLKIEDDDFSPPKLSSRSAAAQLSYVYPYFFSIYGPGWLLA